MIHSDLDMFHIIHILDESIEPQAASESITNFWLNGIDTYHFVSSSEVHRECKLVLKMKHGYTLILHIIIKTGTSTHAVRNHISFLLVHYSSKITGPKLPQYCSLSNNVLNVRCKCRKRYNIRDYKIFD